MVNSFGFFFTDCVICEQRQFYLSDLSTLSLQPFISCTSGFPALVLVPIEVCALVSCDSLYHSLVDLLNVGGSCFTLWLHFSEGSNRSCWLFSLFRFLIYCENRVVTSSLYARPESGSLLHRFLEFTLPTESCVGTLFFHCFSLIELLQYGIP